MRPTKHSGPPERKTEADVVGEIYYQLRQKGYAVRLEYRIDLPSGRRMRADIAVWKHAKAKKPPILIEVKTRQSKSKRTNKERTVQQLKYQESGLVYTYCFGAKEINKTLAWVDAVFSEPRPSTEIRKAGRVTRQSTGTDPSLAGVPPREGAGSPP